MRLRCIFILSGALIFQGSFARDVYVTDVLQLQLRETPEATAKDLQKLQSGDRLTWLEERSGFSKVKTEGGQTGWVKSWFLVDEPPASTLLQNAKETNSQLEKQIESLNSQLEKLKDNSLNKQLQEKVTSLQKKVKLNEQQNQSYLAENASLRKEISKYRFLDTKALLWIAAILVGIGFLLGVIVITLYKNSRQRKRLSGFRLAD